MICAENVRNNIPVENLGGHVCNGMTGLDDLFLLMTMSYHHLSQTVSILQSVRLVVPCRDLIVMKLNPFRADSLGGSENTKYLLNSIRVDLIL